MFQVSGDIAGLKQLVNLTLLNLAGTQVIKIRESNAGIPPWGSPPKALEKFPGRPRECFSECGLQALPAPFGVGAQAPSLSLNNGSPKKQKIMWAPILNLCTYIGVCLYIFIT